MYLHDQFELGLQLARRSPPKEVAASNLPLILSIEGYDSILGLSPASKIHWPAQIFSTKEKVASAAERIYLVGPSRGLMFGPYLGLPKGKWKSTVFFSTADNASRNRVGLEVAQKVKDILTSGEFELPMSGTYSCEMTFINVNPHLPIEVRLKSTQGAIEGELCFRRESRLNGNKIVQTRR